MRRLLFLLPIIIMLASPSLAYADIAPPAQPPGSNPQPGSEATQVRMLTETVLIEVQSSAPANSLGQAHVVADFTMRNLGQQAESMAARFPISASDGFFGYPEIKDLQVRVNGRTVSTRRIRGEDPHGGSEPVPWAEFDVSFPPGQDVQIQVKYTLEASGEYPFIWFEYILSSGAGWKGSIGSADLIVHLPYEANLQNVLFDSGEGYIGTTPGGVIHGDEIRWHFDDLEPTVADNFQVDLIMPSAWERALAEQASVKQNPNDGEAWGRLGKLYKEMAFSSRGKGFRMDTPSADAGAGDLYQLSLGAYEKAVTLLPKDALWHAGFAELLAQHAYFAAFNGEDTADEALRALAEIQKALELAPQDPKVQEIADEISFYFPQGMQRNGDAFEFPWLATPTPPGGTPLPTPTLRLNPASPTPTSLTPTAQAAPARGPSLPLCGSAALIPLAALWLVWRRRQ